MKLVIDIDKSIYDCVIGKTVLISHVDKICKAIADGTPLPKGHGRLIDADWVKNILDIYVLNEYNGQFIRRSDIDSIPTIIEADGGEEK